jgi:copper chaperone CopZ
MKNILFIMLALFGGISLSQAQNTDSKWATVKIMTSGTCNMCKETIETALAYEKGVKKSDFDVESQVVIVTYNPTKTTPDKIRQAISKAGYDADDVKADPKAYEKLDECCKNGEKCDDPEKKH